MQAMILAAGFGTRLLPHTLVRPKPLFPILNVPLLHLTVRRLQRFGFDHIIVNAHHLRKQITAELEEVSGVVVVEEDTILGTGGGLRNAFEYCKNGPLLVSNGDIYHTIDYGKLYETHCTSRHAVTLAMHDFTRFNSVSVEGDRVISFEISPKKEGELQLAYTGLQVINPGVLANISAGKYSCIIDHYKSLLESNCTIGVYRSDTSFWTDMGTPEDYLALHDGLINGAIPAWSDISECIQPRMFANGKNIHQDTKVEDWAVVGDAEIGANCTLQKVVAWDGVRIPAGSVLANQIISS